MPIVSLKGQKTTKIEMLPVLYFMKVGLRVQSQTFEMRFGGAQFEQRH